MSRSSPPHLPVSHMHAATRQSHLPLQHAEHLPDALSSSSSSSSPSSSSSSSSSASSFERACAVCTFYQRHGVATKTCSSCNLFMCTLHAEGHAFRSKQTHNVLDIKSYLHSRHSLAAPPHATTVAASPLAVATAIKQSNLFDADTRTRVHLFFEHESMLQLPEFEKVDRAESDASPRMSVLADTLQRGTFATADEFFAQATRMLDRIASKKADPSGDEGFLASQHRFLVHMFEKHIQSASSFTTPLDNSLVVDSVVAAIERVERSSCAHWLRGSRAPFDLEPAQLAPSEQLTLASLKDRVRAGTLAHALGIMLDARRTLWEFVAMAYGCASDVVVERLVDALDVDEKTVQNMAKRRRNDACFMLLLLYRELNSALKTTYDSSLKLSAREQARMQVIVDVDDFARLQRDARDILVNSESRGAIKDVIDKVLIRDFPALLEMYSDVAPPSTKLLIASRMSSMSSSASSGYSSASSPPLLSSSVSSDAEAPQQLDAEALQRASQLSPAQLVAVLHARLRKSTKSEFQSQIWRQVDDGNSFLLLLAALTLREIDPHHSFFTSFKDSNPFFNKISFFTKHNQGESAASVVFERFSTTIRDLVMELWACRTINTYLLASVDSNCTAFFELIDSRRVSWCVSTSKGPSAGNQDLIGICTLIKSIDEVFAESSAPSALQPPARPPPLPPLSASVATKSKKLVDDAPKIVAPFGSSAAQAPQFVPRVGIFPTLANAQVPMHRPVGSTAAPLAAPMSSKAEDDIRRRMAAQLTILHDNVTIEQATTAVRLAQGHMSAASKLLHDGGINEDGSTNESFAHAVSTVPRKRFIVNGGGDNSDDGSSDGDEGGDSVDGDDSVARTSATKRFKVQREPTGAIAVSDDGRKTHTCGICAKCCTSLRALQTHAGVHSMKERAGADLIWASTSQNCHSAEDREIASRYWSQKMRALSDDKGGNVQDAGDESDASDASEENALAEHTCGICHKRCISIRALQIHSGVHSITERAKFGLIWATTMKRALNEHDRKIIRNFWAQRLRIAGHADGGGHDEDEDDDDCDDGGNDDADDYSNHDGGEAGHSRHSVGDDEPDGSEFEDSGMTARSRRVRLTVPEWELLAEHYKIDPDPNSATIDELVRSVNHAGFEHKNCKIWFANRRRAADRKQRIDAQSADLV